MTKAPQLLLPAAIWIGWGHLDGLLKKGEALTEANGCLVQNSLLANSARILGAVAGIAPTLLTPEIPKSPLEVGAPILDNLLEAIGKLFERADDRFWYQRRFLEIIDSGNRSGRFSIPITRVPLPPVPEPASPFQQRRIGAAVAIKRLIADFVDSLRLPPPSQGNTRWGRVMLSALLFGGLPRARWLLAIPAALQQGADPELRWLDLVIEVTQRPPRASASGARKRKHTHIPESKIRVMRRWFPDPLTRILLREIRSSPPPLPAPGARATDSSIAFRLIKDYLRQHDLAEHLPSSFGSLSDAVKIRMHQFLPPYLVEYAFENIESTSLGAAAWKRLVEPPERLTTELPTRWIAQLPTGPMPSPGPAAAPGAPTAVMEALEESTGDDDTIPLRELELWPEQLLELRLIIRQDYSGAKGKIETWLEAQKGHLLPSVRWVASWVVDDLLETGPQRRAKRRSTIYQFLRTAGAQLAAHLGGADPACLGDEDDYADLYEEVLDDVSETSLAVRRTTANALRSFHQYLMHKCSADQCPSVPEVESTGVFVVSGRGGNRVDANVVGLSTYFLALRELKQANAASEPDEVIEALARIAGLGYFASLRRSEAIGLTVADVIMAGEEVILEVRPNPTRLLKTDNSWRRLPLHVLMPRRELQDFRAWVKGRQSAGSTSPLFPMFVRPQGVRDTDPRLALIVSALQVATGDPTFRFHHLRHSFATWQVVQFWIAEQGAQHMAIPPWFLPTDHDLGRWRIAKRARTQLLGSAPTNRRSLLQVSQLLGHGSLDVTLGSYVHLLDFLLGRTIRRLAPAIDLATLAMLTGVPDDALRRLRSSSSAAAQGAADDAYAIWLDAVFDGPRPRGRPRRQALPLAKVNFQEPAKLLVPTNPYARLMHEMEAVNAWLASGRRNLHEVAARYDVATDQIASAAEVLKKLPPGMSVNFLTREDGPIATGVAASAGTYAPPHAEAQREIAERVLRSVDEVRAGGKEAPRKVVKALVSLVTCWIPGSYLAAKFHTVRDAKDWLWLLDRIDLKEATLEDLVVVTHVPGKGPSTPRADVQRDYWQRQLQRASVQANDPGLLEAHANRHTRGVVIIDIDRNRLPILPSPLKRIANFEGVRLLLIAMFCRLPPAMLHRVAGNDWLSAHANPTVSN